MVLFLGTMHLSTVQYIFLSPPPDAQAVISVAKPVDCKPGYQKGEMLVTLPVLK